MRTSTASNGKLGGSLVLNNIKLNNVPTAVGVVGGATVLGGGSTTIAHWVQGNVYTGTNPTGRFVQGSLTPPNKPSVLLDGSGRIFGKTHPQYAAYSPSQFVSVRSNGAVGDGNTDDTAAINNIIAKAGIRYIVLRSKRSLCVIVRWLQDHLFRPGHLSRVVDDHYPCRNADRRRGVVRHHGRRFRVRKRQQSYAGCQSRDVWLNWIGGNFRHGLYYERTR